MRSTQFFAPHGGFSLITSLLVMLHYLLFQDLKGHRFLDACDQFLVREFYLSVLFKLKIGPSLSHSCPMVSMFIIMQIIIRIIKTTCFENTILMAELEGKLP